MGTCVHFSHSLPSNSWWQTMVGWHVLSRPSAAEGGGRRPAFTGLATSHTRPPRSTAGNINSAGCLKTGPQYRAQRRLHALFRESSSGIRVYFVGPYRGYGDLALSPIGQPASAFAAPGLSQAAWGKFPTSSACRGRIPAQSRKIPRSTSPFGDVGLRLRRGGPRAKICPGSVPERSNTH
jgi:hypothetical protein